MGRVARKCTTIQTLLLFLLKSGVFLLIRILALCLSAMVLMEITDQLISPGDTNLLLLRYVSIYGATEMMFKKKTLSSKIDLKQVHLPLYIFFSNKDTDRDMARVMTRVDTRKQQLTAHLRVTAKDQDMANKVVIIFFTHWKSHYSWWRQIYVIFSELGYHLVVVGKALSLQCKLQLRVHEHSL